MKIYIVRHGQTEWNLIDKVLGCETDMPLNETGRAQAHMAGARLREDGVRFDHVYSSPLSRARETAEIIIGEMYGEASGALEGAPEITLCPDLREMTFGKYEGGDRWDPEYQAAKRDFFKRYPGGESYFDVAHRVYRFLDFLREQPYETVLIATHGGIVRILKNYFVDMENEEFAAFIQPNAEYLTFEL